MTCITISPAVGPSRPDPGPTDTEVPTEPTPDTETWDEAPYCEAPEPEPNVCEAPEPEPTFCETPAEEATFDDAPLILSE